MTTLTRSIEYLSPIIDSYVRSVPEKALVIGISGPQGSGKSYLTNALGPQLRTLYPKLNIVLFLMDDLYLTHEDQLELTNRSRKYMDDNKLLQGRGLPGTHDITLGTHLFSKLMDRSPQLATKEISIPFYDKGAFNGEGDRSPHCNWNVVQNPVDVIIFEGWFNGFQPLSFDQLRVKYLTSDLDKSVIQRHKMFHVEQVNANLKEYAKLWSLFDYFIYLETDSLKNVYNWRLEQEHYLKATTPAGTSMTDEEVIKFVDRYMPIYELYYDTMCSNGCVPKEGHNLKLVIDAKRNILDSMIY
mmetsp:Transcript_873/g.986  ORF Transcript_873/g.986 Transcript_873/m.986 type:complete len:300 (+) Transcript_873:1148-2047(+)